MAKENEKTESKADKAKETVKPLLKQKKVLTSDGFMPARAK